MSLSFVNGVLFIALTVIVVNAKKNEVECVHPVLLSGASIDDSIAKQIDVSSTSSGSNIEINIEFTRDDNQIENKQYLLWENTSIG